MKTFQRRKFLRAASSAVSSFSFVQSDSIPDPRANLTPSRKIGVVGRGEDRLGKSRNVGVSQTSFEVCTEETRGNLFVIENVIVKRGGPPLHLHYNEDEYFYIVEGEFVLQIGGQQFNLKAGDSILGPRKVPHAYAFVGESPGRLLISYAPANKMQDYFATRGEGQRYSSDAARFRAYGMELLGPPIHL